MHEISQYRGSRTGTALPSDLQMRQNKPEPRFSCFYITQTFNTDAVAAADNSAIVNSNLTRAVELTR